MNRSIYITIIYLLFSQLLSAQQKYVKELIPMSPDVWTFMKYGTSSTVDLYTGTLRESIPLYTYTDREFDLPITVNYSTNGYMPDTSTGVTGLGWTLHAGGCITREVKQCMDESGVAILGSLNMYREDYSSNPLDGAYIDSEQTGMVYLNQESNMKYETEPDIFSFNFLGHHGKFIIIRGPNRIFRCQVFETDATPGAYVVTPYVRLGVGGTFSFDITTGDGFRYRFENIEGQDDNYSFSYEYGNPANGTSQMTWMLRSITSPSGRSMTFHYQVLHNFISVRPSSYKSAMCFENIDSGSLEGLEELFQTHSIRQYLRFCSSTAALSSIVVEDTGFRVDFHYGDRAKVEMVCRGGSQREPLNRACQLDSIEFRYSRDKVLRSVGFDYGYPSEEGNAVLLLKRVRISGVGEYLMEYNRESAPFPFQGTTSIDHWGFFNDVNARYEIGEMIPEIVLGDSWLDQSVSGTSRREPDFDAALTGTLRKLVYPTGGSTEYTYEPNTYSFSLRRSSLTDGCLSMREEDMEQECGGVRIKSIQSGNMTKAYTYGYPELGGGILEKYPYYYQFMSVYDSISEVYQCQASAASFSNLVYALDANHVCYPFVTETLSNGGRTEYTFTSHMDADCQDFYPDSTMFRNIYDGVSGGAMMNEAYVYPDSRHFTRGKEKIVRHYAAGSINPWKEEKIQYVAMSVADHEYLNSGYGSVIIAYPHRLYLQNYLCSAHETIIYEGRDSIKTAVRYSFNQNGQIIEQNYLDYGRGVTEIDRKQYVTDVDEDEEIYDMMLSMGMHGYVIKELTAFCPTVDTGDSRYRLTSGKKYNYSLVEEIPVLHEVSQARIAPSNPGGFCGFDFDNLLVHDVTYDYSTALLPIEETSKDGITTTYLWGYSGMYPIAVLTNCSLSHYYSLIEDYYGDTVVFSGAMPAALKELLYSDHSFETVVYEYSPHVGITSVTDIAGRTTYYRYDESGRLIQVVDDQGHQMKEYRYHLKSE